MIYKNKYIFQLSKKQINCQNDLTYYVFLLILEDNNTIHNSQRDFVDNEKSHNNWGPIKYRIDDINQVQMNSEIGLIFSSILRSALIQSQTVIMVGEIKDGETSELAIQGAFNLALRFQHLALQRFHRANK